MNRSIRVLFLTALISVFACAGTPRKETDSILNLEERAWLENHGTIQVGVFNDYPPVGFLDESGHPQGMAIDFWRLVARNLDLDVTFTPCAFWEQLDGLASGRFDSLAGIFDMEERRALFDFSIPYFSIYTYIYTKPELQGVEEWSDLKGLRVGVVEGDSGQTLAYKTGINAGSYATYLEIVLGLLHKKLDAVVLDELVVEYYASSYNALDRIRKAGRPLDHGALSLPVRKGNSVLLSILNKGVRSVAEKDLRMIELEWLEQKEQ